MKRRRLLQAILAIFMPVGIWDISAKGVDFRPLYVKPAITGYDPGGKDAYVIYVHPDSYENLKLCQGVKSLPGPLRSGKCGTIDGAKIIITRRRTC